MLAKQLYLIFYIYIPLLKGLRIKIQNQTNALIAFTALTLVHTTNMFCLDYCNSLLTQLVASALVLLQMRPNTAVRIFLLKY